MKGLFITGTDTGIGKTWFTLACITALQKTGKKTVAMKPVASGADRVNGQLRNEDALLIQQALKHEVDYELINPYVFAEAVSPHIAAAHANQEIEGQKIQQAYQKLTVGAEFVLVEAVGGWLAPLSSQWSVADMASMLGLPVVLVVGMRLGCLNHAMLTARAIQDSGLHLSGWVANVMEPDLDSLHEQIDYLSEKLGQNPIAILGWKQTPCLSDEDLGVMFDAKLR